MERKEIIANNEKWFKFFVYLPKILTIIYGVFFFIWGIIDPAIYQIEYYLYRGYDILYGSMRLGTFFGATIVWWAIGVVACILIYVITKLALSYSILHIYYLQDLRETNQKLLKIKENEVKTESEK